MGAADQLVGLGASAGGLEPLQEFFDAMPIDSGMAFVVIQHLSPDHPSMMDELLARHTSMRVLRVQDDTPVEPNTVYVIPSRKNLRVSEGRLRLTDQVRTGDGPPTPIDVFFDSMATEYGERCAAVVLSGTGSDGSRGIQKVHTAGGRTIAQDKTAKFDGMPQAAIDTGCVDMVLSPADMPALLTGQEDSDGVRPSILKATPGIYEVLEILRERFGIDFSQYKITTMLRRIERRLHITRTQSIAAYVKLLTANESEQDNLYRDLLIGVTQFFRDPEAFEVLERRVIPTLVREAADREEGLRVWVCACASGEEAYSIAILIREAMEREKLSFPVRVFATDVFRGSIAAASAGVYNEQQISGVRPDRLERFFLRTGDTYQVRPELRGIITFAPHDILTDAPFTRIDLVMCRHMLIYLKPPAQHRSLALLHFALRREGVLILGSSETAGKFHDEFTTIDPHWRIYQKIRDVRLLMQGEITGIAPRVDVSPRATAPVVHVNQGDARVQKAYDAILADAVPAGFLINDRRELLHSFGSANSLMRPPSGRVSLDVLEMVDPELRVPLGAAIVRAIKENKPIGYTNVSLEIDGTTRPRVITAKPIRITGDGPPYVIITITDAEAPPKPATVRDGADAGESTEHFQADQLTMQKLDALEHELQYTKESLQATIEEMETTNEELNATNEELIASNEELQSTNEELQSVNEELHTVNAEHQQKIRELTKLTDDMDNLLGCTNVGTLFLDPNMSVRKFTSAVTDHFRLRDSDVGRPLDEISSRIRAPDLIDRARRVFESGAGEQFEALGGGGVALLIGVNPYRTGRGLVDGVVVTIVDIDSLKEAEQRAAALSTQNQLILDHIPAMVWYKDRMCRIVRANRAAAELTGLPISEIEGKSTEELHPAEAERYIRDDREVMKSGTPKLGIIEPVRDSEDSERWVRTDKVPLFGEDGAVNGLLAVTTDITDVKKTEDALVRTSRLLELSQRAAQQGHFTLDLRTDELHVSDEWKAALGYEPFEAQIGSTGELLAVVHAEDRPALRDAIETCRRGETARLDRTHRINAKIGGPVWVRSIGEVYEREEGVPARVVGTLTVVDDVVRAQLELERVNADLESVVRERTAELEVSKKRFERAINGAQKGVWEWVPPDEACWFADHFWEILGFRREDHPPPLLSSFHERIHPDELDMTRESLDRLAHHGGLLSVRLRLWTQDGNYRWFQLRALRDTEPGLNRVVLTGSIVDVHDEVSAREALETTKSELEARVAARTEELSANVQTLADRNEQLDQFAHVAAHDLRAPLRTIAGNAELAIMGRGPAENAQNGTTDRHLEKILAGTRRMSELIDSLSAYSRVGRADCLIDDADLDRIIEGIRADLETDLAESGGELVSGPLGVVRADPRMIAQVLRNLIANGIKFVRDKPPRVAVSRDDRDGETRIRVTDNGIGIDSQFRAAIFEPFKRLNAGSEFAGSGVGLSICRRIVERHGGEIWVESVPEGGSSFVFTLPSVVSTA